MEGARIDNSIYISYDEGTFFSDKDEEGRRPRVKTAVNYAFVKGGPRQEVAHWHGVGVCGISLIITTCSNHWTLLPVIIRKQ